MRYIRVTNWDRYQHYKVRKPVWVKLYLSFFDSFAISELPDSTKAHAIGLLILAGRTQNRIPFDSKWIRNRISASARTIDFTRLFASGFIEFCKQDAIPNQEPRTKKPREEEKENTKRNAPRNHRLPRPNDVARLMFGTLSVRELLRKGNVRSPAHLVAVGKAAKLSVQRVTELLVQIVRKPPEGVTIKNHAAYVVKISQNEAGRNQTALASDGALEFLKTELQVNAWQKGDPECSRCGYPLNDAHDAKDWKRTGEAWACCACLAETQKGD